MKNNKRHRIYPPILQRSREMRHPLTSAEKTVWGMVRNNQLGYKIRRQHPIDRFIIDFYCPRVKLIIEIDGDSHSRMEQAKYDVERTAWLEGGGYSVMRFENDEVKENPSLVVEKILKAIIQLVNIIAPTPPSPLSGEEFSPSPLPPLPSWERGNSVPPFV